MWRSRGVVTAALLADGASAEAIAVMLGLWGMIGLLS